MSDTLAPAPTPMSTRDKTTIATLLVAAFVVILNETIMGVALPRLMTDLSLSARTGQWLTTAFMLTLAVVIPTTGFLLQRLTTRRVFLLAMSLFCAGTLLAAVSPAFWMLLPARIVQASGTAMMIPLLMTTVLTLVPRERRGVVMGNISVVISVAPAIGPALSGLILQYFSWRFMFFFVLPVAVAAMILGGRRLENVGEPGRNSLDVLSVFLSVPAFGGIVYGLSQLGSTSAVVPVTCLVIGVICLLLFGVRQTRLGRREAARHAADPDGRQRGPLLDLGAFRFRMFSLSLTLLCIAMMGLFGVIILLPLYLQQVHGISSFTTGFMLLPGGVLMGVLSPQVGKLFDRYGPKVLTIVGSVTLTLVLWRFTTLEPTTPIWLLVILHVVMMGSLAFIFTPAFTTALNPLPPRLYSHGSATLSTLQQVAGAAGTALLVAVMSSRTVSLTQAGTNPVLAQNSGIQSAFWVATCIAAGSIVCAFFMRSTQTDPEPDGHGHGPDSGVEPAAEPTWSGRESAEAR